MLTVAEYDAFRDYLCKMASGYVPTHEVAEAYRLATEPLQARLDAATALLMTLMDIAAEASAERQTYDFKPRAGIAASKARAFLAEAK